MKVTLVLDIDADYFGGWPARYTEEVWDLRFPTEEGQVGLTPAIPVTQPGRGLAEKVLGMAMSVHPDYLFNRKPEVFPGMQFVILFDIEPLAPKRIEVAAQCSHPALVPYFKGLLTEIEKRWPEAREQPERGPKPTDKSGQPLPPNFPKKGSTFDKYGRAYSIIVEYGQEYQQEYHDLRRDRPTPMIDDYRDALADRMDWRPSGKTVQTIIKLGEEGFLQSKCREMAKYPNK